MRPPLSFLLSIVAAVGLEPTGVAEEPFLRPHDVIALVGGEDMVAASEYGYLELLLSRALPGHQLRFRDLACEGDTVFEQRRELNFPTWEEQLDKIGATVVICQFGQMESLGRSGEGRGPKGESGADGVRGFIAAYEKLIERMAGPASVRSSLPYLADDSPDRRAPVLPPPASGRPARRVLLILPARNLVEDVSETRRQELGNTLPLYVSETAAMAVRLGCLVSDLTHRKQVVPSSTDGIHLSRHGHWIAAQQVARSLGASIPLRVRPEDSPDTPAAERLNPLADLIVAKNRLWFDYWRPHNWAFLAGDRTVQPSSQDHLDPSKRWFPAEREAFLPLIEAKEKEIHALAAQIGGLRK